MSLVTGARLGPYEVVALIGAGGMGQCIVPETRALAAMLRSRSSRPAHRQPVPWGLSNLVVTPDGRSYFYSFTQGLTDLVLVEGVR